MQVNAGHQEKKTEQLESDDKVMLRWVSGVKVQYQIESARKHYMKDFTFHA